MTDRFTAWTVMIMMLAIIVLLAAVNIVQHKNIELQLQRNALIEILKCQDTNI